MKGTPRKSRAGVTDTTLINEAMTVANEYTEMSRRDTIDKSQAPLKTIAVRINEVDYNRLRGLFGAQGTNLSQAGRAAIFRLADQLEAGILEIPNGIVRERRG